MRAIIRYSLNADQSNLTGNTLRSKLEERSFVRIGTGCLEGDEPSDARMFSTLREVLQVLEDAPGGGTLDHLWIYLDRSDETARASFEMPGD